MHAVLSYGPCDLRVADVPDPVPEAGEVLIAVKASAICGSDKWLWRAESVPMRVFGHELAGEVIEAGPGVAKLSVGDRVAVNNVIGCGVCSACARGAYVKCPGWKNHDVNGGFGELVVAPERNCMKLRDGIDCETGCLLFDNWGTPLGAVERACVVKGETVAVVGCGPIGLAAVRLASLRQARVIAVDPVGGRRAAAEELGARLTVEAVENLPEETRRLRDGELADVVIECSGKGIVYVPAMDALAHDGRFVAVGEGASLELKPSRTLIRRHQSLLGTWYSTMPQGEALQEMVLRGDIDPKRLVTHRCSLRDMPATFRAVVEDPENVLKAVIVNP